MPELDLRCVCGARWNGGPLPPGVAEKFTAIFEREHSGHTERDVDAPDDEDEESLPF